MNILSRIWPWSEIHRRELEVHNLLMETYFRDKFKELEEFQTFITRSWTPEECDAAVKDFAEWQQERKKALSETV